MWGWTPQEAHELWLEHEDKCPDWVGFIGVNGLWFEFSKNWKQELEKDYESIKA
jgi:hypothetical protein